MHVYIFSGRESLHLFHLNKTEWVKMAVNRFICSQCANNGLIWALSSLKEITFSGVDSLHSLNNSKHSVALVAETKNEKI